MRAGSDTARQLRLLSDALDSGRLGPVRRHINTLTPSEIGNLLESLPPGKREVVWGLVDARMTVKCWSTSAMRCARA